ncbi:uncharacterized protein JCM15063_001360 [Sporobolomyces koalae]|uniref:uncharacterized protein n=1 Tax=Sporobolomyces koalae TaxID=500713 RepID=UPI00316FF124
MRVKRWLTPPSSRPPEASLVPARAAVAAAAAVAASPLARCVPARSTPPTPAPVPASIAAAREYARQAAVRRPGCTGLDPYEHLGRVLSELPPISHHARLLHLPQDRIERDLQQWRTACRTAYELLNGPLRFHRHKFRNSVVRIVAHTMRILLKIGHVNAANKLERAFFTTEPVPFPHRESDPTGTTNTCGFGNGLGLDRGLIRIAWMQSIALRLRQNATSPMTSRQAAEFAHFLEEMLVPDRGDLLNGIMLAFVVRNLEVMHFQLRGGVRDRKLARRQLRRLLASIRKAESGGEPRVSLALLDQAISKLERQPADHLDPNLLQQTEREIEALIGTLDGSTLDPDLHALHDLHREYPDLASIERHAHILYLAIRFLLLRARTASLSPELHPLHTDTLASASQLYTLLLDLSASIPASVPDLSRLRRRQSSALYRLLWSHLGVFEVPAHNAPERLPSPDLESTLPSIDLSLIRSAYELIDATLDSTAALNLNLSELSTETGCLATHLAQDPRLVGVATRFHRQALYLLSLPSAPTRRRFDQTFPPWSTFERVFDTISRQRLNDMTCLSHERRRRRHRDVEVHETRNEWERDLIVQPAFAIHLLRATLLASSNPPSSSSMSNSGLEKQEQETPISRLNQLIKFVQTLEHGQGRQGGRRFESKAKNLFRKAVQTVVEHEWNGPGMRTWKDLVISKVQKWY